MTTQQTSAPRCPLCGAEMREVPESDAETEHTDN